MEENKIAVTPDMKAADNVMLQYIVVKIGNEQYGISIKYIDNIVRMQRITRVPKAQRYFRGVINLRGEVIPVMSLRAKLNLDTDEFTDKTRIIIIKIDNGTVGMIVDEVKEVVTLQEEEIEKVVYDGTNDRVSSFLSGIGKSKGELISLLDINTLLLEN